MSEAFLFYNSFRSAVEFLPEEDKLPFLLALIDYGLDGTEPSLPGPSMAAFAIARFSIDASNGRRDNGKKGGRPKTTQKTQEEKTSGFESAKPVVSESENQWFPDVKTNGFDIIKPMVSHSENQWLEGSETTPSIYGNGNGNGNGNLYGNSNIDRNGNGDGNGDGNEEAHAPAHEETDPVMPLADNVSMKRSEYRALVSKYGEKDTKAMIEKLDAYKAATGKKYASDYSAILSWVVTWLKEDKAKKRKQVPAFEGGTDATAEADNKAAKWMREVLGKEGGP